MQIRIKGAREHNLKGVDVEFGEGLTAVTGVSGSGKTSLVFDTLYHEARRRFLEIYALGSARGRLQPARADSLTGLGPAVAVGQNLLNRNPNSTLSTASGLHPFFRLLFAHYAQRACPQCDHPLSVYSEDQIVERLVDLSSTGDIRISAPLLQAVPGSHRTLLGSLLKQLERRKIWVDGQPWNGNDLKAGLPHDIELELAQLARGVSAADLRAVVKQAAGLGALTLTVRWNDEAQTLARVPVCIACGAWFGDLRPVDFNRRCPHCQGKGCDLCAGTGLPPQASAARWSGLRFKQLLNLPVDEALDLFADRSRAAASERIRNEISRRLSALQRVGLGYIALDRPSPTLSRGEAQRVRLALTLISRLEDMLHVLDEPTIGQHPADVARLLPAFRDLAGPVVFVEHERAAVAQSDWTVDLGPGAGRQGGEVVFSGPPAELWQADCASGRFFSLRDRVERPRKRPPPAEFLTIRGARLRNLKHIDVAIPLGRLSVVTGVSGSGKSTLVEDVLAASLASGQPTGCMALEGTQLKPVVVDQSPIGRNPRSNPATYTKLADIIRDLYAAVSGLSPSYFSFNRPEGACPTCAGLGAVEVSMRYLPAAWIPCADCNGKRFSEEVLAVTVPFGDVERSIAGFYELPIADVCALFAAEGRLPASKLRSAQHILEALCDIGLGYLPLGQPSPTLSGGEAQRVKLARYLGRKSLDKQLLTLDEPTTGLHPQDLAGLLAVLDRLARHGATIVVVEHNTDMIRAADWVIDLGPGAGADGGRVLFTGSPEALIPVDGSLTARALREEETLAPLSPKPLRSMQRTPVIDIQGARAHNLKDIDVQIPKGQLTVVTGLSGSGKSSLVHDVLEAEARRRFLETLSLYERQGLQEGAEAQVEAISGLGVTLTVGSERLVYAQRATVGTATEISPRLAVLFAALGERACLDCETQMERGAEWLCPACGGTAPLAAPRHFNPTTYAAACRRCNGVGSLQFPNPQKLIVQPQKPLVEGAMYSPGFFPNGYLGKPFNHGYYMLLALAEAYHFDPHTTPWQEMSAQAQQAFLFGTDDELAVTAYGRSGRAKTFQAKFPGFYGFIRDWDVGGTYTDTQPCPACHGARLRPEYLAVRLMSLNIHEVSQMTLRQLADWLALVKSSDSGLATLIETAQQRLHFLIQVGLGYLHLDRIAGTLSAGEVQRIRLASLLGSGLTALTILADEPTRGLHPSEVEALLSALLRLRDRGNTVIIVEHDPQVISAAEHILDIGPNAGQDGGQIVAQGPLAEIVQTDTHTARWLRGEGDFTVSERHPPSGWLTIRGARAHNLVGQRVDLPLGVLAGVCGVSGSGKSTLVIDTLGRALAPKKQTTSVAYEPVDPGEHAAIEGAPARVVIVDQSKAGLSSPGTFLNLTQPLQTLFAASPDAQALGLGIEQFRARCSECKGRGQVTLDMSFLPDVHLPCETCRGSGYIAETWQVRLNGLSLPEVFALTIDEVYDRFGDHPKLAHPLQAARQVGLGYLVLRQPGRALSGGEAQRLKIAAELNRKQVRGALYILDEPSIGQHLEDVSRLIGVLRRLVAVGNSVLLVEHHIHMLAACDWLLEMGPGGGPDGGRVIASGTPEQIAAGDTPTASYLKEAL